METGIITLNKISIIVTLAITEEAMNIVLHLSFMRKKEYGCIKDGDIAVNFTFIKFSSYYAWSRHFFKVIMNKTKAMYRQNSQYSVPHKTYAVFLK